MLRVETKDYDFCVSDLDLVKPFLLNITSTEILF